MGKMGDSMYGGRDRIHEWEFEAADIAIAYDCRWKFRVFANTAEEALKLGIERCNRNEKDKDGFYVSNGKYYPKQIERISVKHIQDKEDEDDYGKT